MSRDGSSSVSMVVPTTDAAVRPENDGMSSCGVDGRHKTFVAFSRLPFIHAVKEKGDAQWSEQSQFDEVAFGFNSLSI